jgi:hypothetical protein
MVKVLFAQLTDCRGPTALAMTYLVICVITRSITKYVIARSEATRQSVGRMHSLLNTLACFIVYYEELCHE